MTSSRRTFLAAACAALAAAPFGPALAQAFPNKPVRIVVPYTPGGPSDIAARAVGQKLAEQLGQPVIVENKPGAGGNTGADLVARAPADGYTLMLVTTGHTINPSLYEKLGYNLLSDFAPVSQITSSPMVVAVSPSLGVNDMRGLIALAKAKPGALNFASAGNGSSTHLAPELFALMAGVKMTHVPYKGSAPALADVMAGHAQVAFDFMTSAMPHVRSGKLKGLATTGATRSAAAPELPTVAESGVPGFEVIGWNGLVVPAATPKDIVAKLSAEIRKALESADVKARFAGLGAAAHPTTPEQLGALMRSEVEKWAKVVKASGAKAE
ncbi:MAG: tripartite tricarboxylate transporter substrate binding protein [Burkholderiales bacterium]|nr:tripartite tricarboxylate transporter substrate binding protein [Burkholderiales bacterium]